MHAIMRINTFDTRALASAGGDVGEFDRLNASQPGYVGTLSIDLGADRRLVVNLWETEGHAARALEVVGGEADRVLRPLMAEPSRLLGAGEVVKADLRLS